MNALRLLLAGLFAVMLTFGSNAGEKTDNAKRLLGSWEVVKTDGLPIGSVMDFGKEGKLQLSVKEEGKDHKAEGSYQLDGNKIALTVNWSADKVTKHTFTIQNISEKNLTIEDEKGKGVEFKRKQ